MTENVVEKIDIEGWLAQLLPKLAGQFGPRLWFVGLQGSYGRGEAGPGSDIDVVVILDKLELADIAAYRQLLAAMPAREMICGFFGGRGELLGWEPAELLQFYHDTRPLLGSLDELLPLLDGAAVARAIQDGACGIYHSCVHNLLHERDEQLLRGLYKGAVFVVQAVVYQQQGRFVRRQQELLSVATEPERQIVATALALKAGAAVDFEPMSGALFSWAQGLLRGRSYEHADVCQ